MIIYWRVCTLAIIRGKILVWTAGDLAAKEKTNQIRDELIHTCGGKFDSQLGLSGGAARHRRAHDGAVPRRPDGNAKKIKMWFNAFMFLDADKLLPVALRSRPVPHLNKSVERKIKSTKNKLTVCCTGGFGLRWRRCPGPSSAPWCTCRPVGRWQRISCTRTSHPDTAHNYGMLLKLNSYLKFVLFFIILFF